MADYSTSSSSGFTIRSTPTTTYSTGWSSSKWGGWKSGSKKYKSSLGYDESSFYDYSRGSYWSTYRSSYTDPANKKDLEKLLISAYKSVREAVVILDFPFRVDICFSVNSFVRNDSKAGRKLFLATSCLDKSEGRSDADKIDILCGTGIHEAAHLKYTELRTLTAFSKIERHPYKKTIDIFLNLLEDERVEDKLLQERPGYLNYITKKKEYDFTQLPIKSTYSIIAQVIQDLVLYIRYRDKLKDSSVISGFPDIITNVATLLNDNPLASTKDSCILGKQIVLSMISDLEKHFSSSEIKKGFDLIESNWTRFFDRVTNGSDTVADLDLALQNFLDTKVTTLCNISDLRLVEDLASGEKERFASSIFIKVTPDNDDISRYDSIKRSVSKYVPALKKTLISSYKNYDFVIPGCRSGLLDTNKLAEAYQGVPQVYCRQGHVRTNGTVICVLIDESGSMSSGVGRSWGTCKYSVARTAGILLNEAFGYLPGVSLFIYGHTADTIEYRSTEVRIYKEPGSNYNPKSLGAISARCENRDGNAILSVAKRVRKYTNQRCIYFIISDGSPSANGYRGRPAVDDTATKIKLVRDTMDMDIIGVCIDEVPEMHYMYGDRFINLYSDISQFPSLLGKLIKQSISENRNTTIS